MIAVCELNLPKLPLMYISILQCSPCGWTISPSAAMDVCTAEAYPTASAGPLGFSLAAGNGSFGTRIVRVLLEVLASWRIFAQA